MEVLQQLEPLMREIIAPQAAQIDEQARYPRAALDALAAAGLLGLISASEVGGRGKGLAEAVQVIERIAQDCPCTAMVLTMHYCGVALIEPFADDEVRRDIAAGRHITTLAVSEAGSRSHIWAPTGTATDRKSTRLNSRHVRISYAVFCLSKKKNSNVRRSHSHGQR